METKKIISKENINPIFNCPSAYSEYDEYVELLSQAIENEKVKNIGIVAPYGAGKSSLIASYIEKEEKKNKNIKKNILTISLANYIFATSDDEDKPKASYVSESEIEKSILQQLFYRNDGEKTPLSRFSHLKIFHIKSLIISLIFSIFTFIMAGLIIYFNHYEIFKLILTNFFLLIIVLILFTSFCFLINFLLNSKIINKIEIGKLSLETIQTKDISILNAYLDEIIYFFEKNSFNILIIEDMDRLENINIFSKLRELNTLLNNNEQIIKKHSKITFIYAVKDSLFEDEEQRSKFFEYIISIMPSLTNSNIYDELFAALHEEEKVKVTKSVLINIGDYIGSRRILNNIINDFRTHRSCLNINTNNQKAIDELFALMSLKNIYPDEYELLIKQDIKSEIYKFLTINKKIMRKKILIKLNNKINEINEEIKGYTNQANLSFDKLRMLLIGCLYNEGYVFLQFYSDFKTFNKLSTFRFYKLNNGHREIEICDLKIIETKYFGETNYFLKNEAIYNNLYSEKVEKLKEELKENIKKKTTLFSLDFKQLYELDEDSNKLIPSNNFIKLVLINGYINENYIDYMPVSSKHYRTKNDIELQKKIKRKEKIEVFEKIDDVNTFIVLLEDNWFHSPYILNYYLILELIRNENNNEYEVRLNELKKYLNEDNDALKEFLDELLLNNQKCTELLSYFVRFIEKTWYYIYMNNDVEENMKIKLAKSLLSNNNISINYLLKINVNNSFGIILNKINNFNNILSYEKIKKLNQVIPIKLNTLTNFEKSEVNTYLLQNSCYEINYDNIVEILINYYKLNKEYVYTKNFELISNLQDSRVKDYILQNMEKYCLLIYNNIKNGQLSKEYFNNLILSKNISQETKCLIIKKENAKLDYTGIMDDEIISRLLEKNQLIIGLRELRRVYKKLNPNYVKKYLNENFDTLNINSEIMDEDDKFLNFVFENCNLKQLSNKLEKNHYNINDFSEKITWTLIETGLSYYNSNTIFKLFSNEDKLRFYCKKYQPEIIEDIIFGKIKLNDYNIIILYKVLDSDSKLYKVILTKINVKTLKTILGRDLKTKLIDNIENSKYLNFECRKLLLNLNLSQNQKRLLMYYFNVSQHEALYELLGHRFIDKVYASRN